MEESIGVTALKLLRLELCVVCYTSISVCGEEEGKGYLYYKRWLGYERVIEID